MADGEFVVKRNSDRFCGVSNSDWSPFKSRSFHKRTLSKHADIEIVNTKKVHIGGGGVKNDSKATPLKVLHL